MPEVSARGVRFHVQQIGEGRITAVFVHGLVMDNLSSFYFTLAAPAARGARVMLYDLRGHGMSERTPAGYSLNDAVADLDGLLTALAIDHPVFLIGNSYGGLVALAFAAAHPRRVAGLALIDANRGAEGWGDRMAATLDLQGEARDRQIATSFAAWLGRGSVRKSNRLARAARDLVEGTTLVAEMRASPGLAESQLRAVFTPTFAVYGEDSDVRADGEALARLMPDCRLHILPGCSHSVLWEKTAEVRDLILEWLAGAGARR